MRISGILIITILINIHRSISTSIDPPWTRWVGGVWIPKPGWKMYTPHEIALQFNQPEPRRILILGDSLGRRLTATLAAIIEVSSTDNDNVNNNQIAGSLPSSLVENKQLLNFGAHKSVSYLNERITFQWNPTVVNLLTTLKNLDLSTANTFTDLLICIGIHDSMEQVDDVFFDMNVLKQMLEESLELLNKIAIDHNIRVIWRTTPYRWKQEGTSTSPQSKQKYQEPKYSMETNRRVVKFNSIVREWVLNNQNEASPEKERHVYVMEFGREMAPNSIGIESDALRDDTGGPSPEHFNIRGRMVCVEMLMHTWELWNEGIDKLKEGEVDEEDGNEHDLPVGEQQDLDLLLAMERNGQGEVTPFKSILNRLLSTADGPKEKEKDSDISFAVKCYNAIDGSRKKNVEGCSWKDEGEGQSTMLRMNA